SEILREAERILKPSGILGLVHWNYDSKTPRGPKMEIRPRPENLLTLAKKVNFTINSNSIDLPPYHYGIIGNKV
ncbi:MAG: class I SAM-dependent methyltransferase, partial [Leptospira sp.]|nr:class I SAM-dependent methyltransferase [Leptospira sp.]